MADFYMRAGDLLPEIQGTIKYSDGTAVNLTSASAIKFHYKKQGGGSHQTRTAAVVNAAAGQVKYTWVTSDTDTVGTYDYYWEAVFAAGRLTAPNSGTLELQILADL